MSWTAGTYNVLADAYIRPAYYPRVDPGWLDPARRQLALIRHIQQLDLDVLCLQEVEANRFAELERALPGHTGRYARKTGNRPDGCATFVRVPVRDERVVRYTDGAGGADSGHVALIVTVEVDGRLLAVANSHIKWDPPGTPATESWGHRQLAQLLRELPPLDPCAGWVVCGDFNATPEGSLLHAAGAGGLIDPFAGLEHPTCNANQNPRRLDYLLCTRSIIARPRPVPLIDDTTPLPSAEHPSDHLPVVAEMHWAGA